MNQMNVKGEVYKPSRRDAHCGVSGRCRDATAAGASFASETFYIYCDLITELLLLVGYDKNILKRRRILYECYIG